MQLVVTSAWTPHAPRTQSELANRRKRLLDSLTFYRHCGAFRRIVVLDATLESDGEAAIREVLGGMAHLPKVRTQPQGDYQGPSYLEALLYLAATETFAGLNDDETVFKVSGGYIVRNIAEIAQQQARDHLHMLGFLHQNPLRFRPRYAMTACFALDGRAWRRFRNHLSHHLETARVQPLEAVYADFLLQAGCSRGPSMPYPQIDAWFSTAAVSSRSWRYRVREAAWRIYARTGAYVLSRTREPS